MGLKSGIIKVIEQPKSILFSQSRELTIAWYDILTALELHKNIPFKTLVDVGSASGEYTHVFRKMYPNAKVYSFEPVPELHTSVKGYIPQEVALWNKNELLNFYIPSDPRTSSVFADLSSQTKVKKVKAVRFDSLGMKVEGPALLKIDVEGAEKEVLEGFGDELKKFEIVLLELNMTKDHAPSKIMQLMESHGFYRFVQKDLRSDLKQSNIFFIKEQ